jgi:hypothetical protein
LGFCGVVIAIHPTITLMASCPQLVRWLGVNLCGTYFKKLLMLNMWGNNENEIVVKKKAQCEMGTKHDT